VSSPPPLIPLPSPLDPFPLLSAQPSSHPREEGNRGQKGPSKKEGGKKRQGGREPPPNVSSLDPPPPLFRLNLPSPSPHPSPITGLAAGRPLLHLWRLLPYHSYPNATPSFRRDAWYSRALGYPRNLIVSPTPSLLRKGGGRETSSPPPPLLIFNQRSTREDQLRSPLLRAEPGRLYSLCALPSIPLRFILYLSIEGRPYLMHLPLPPVRERERQAPTDIWPVNCTLRRERVAFRRGGGLNPPPNPSADPFPPPLRAWLLIAH
jgi:hypothetical protein